MTFRASVLLATVVTVALAACGDPLATKATLDVYTDTVNVYALSGTPPSVPTAVHISSGAAIRADATFSFDFAADIDASGNVVLLPVRLVASGIATTHTVGLQAVSGTFDALTSAPRTAFRYDSSTVVSGKGGVFVAEITDPTLCAVSLKGAAYFAKLVVDSVRISDRAIFIREVVDPNCGFRSLVSGSIPKD